MEQEGQEDEYIKAFNFLINFQCWHCYDLLLETFYFVLYRDEDCMKSYTGASLLYISSCMWHP